MCSHHAKTCVECGNDFVAKNATAKRCSDKCWRVAFKKRNPGLKATYSKKYRDKISAESGVIPGVVRQFLTDCICMQCSEEFTSRVSTARFCSHKCRMEFRKHNPDAPMNRNVKVRHEKICAECGKPFTAKTTIATTCSATCKTYQWRRLNPEKSKQIDQRFKVKHKDRIRQKKTKWIRDKYHTDPAYRLKRLISASFLRMLKRRPGARKSHRTNKMVGCSWEFLRRYIEAMWRPGMSWETHGLIWEVDHIRPFASFNLIDPAQQMEVCHFSNLQPLFCDENSKKRHRMLSPEQYLRCGERVPIADVKSILLTVKPGNVTRNSVIEDH